MFCCSLQKDGQKNVDVWHKTDPSLNFNTIIKTQLSGIVCIWTKSILMPLIVEMDV